MSNWRKTENTSVTRQFHLPHVRRVNCSNTFDITITEMQVFTAVARDATKVHRAPQVFLECGTVSKRGRDRRSFPPGCRMMFAGQRDAPRGWYKAWMNDVGDVTISSVATLSSRSVTSLRLLSSPERRQATESPARRSHSRSNGPAARTFSLPMLFLEARA